MGRDLDELVGIAQLLEDVALRAHRKNVAEYRALASEIEQLELLRNQTRQESANILHRSAGADVLWQSWLVQKRTETLQKLALARAREGETLVRARFAFSRHSAAKELRDQAMEAKDHARTSAQADAMQSLIMLKAAQK